MFGSWLGGIANGFFVPLVLANGYEKLKVYGFS